MRFYVQVIAGFIFLAASLGGVPASSLAQESPDQVSALPDKYIEEMEGFFTYCKGDDYLKQNFDCRCLSVAYIDKRTEKGPTANSSDIIKVIEKEPCRYDQTTMARPESPEEDFSAIPDEFIDESNEFYKNCNATYQMHMNYDCECLATKFLDKRIENGKDMPPDEILMYISKQCPNVEGAAAHVYERCLTQAPLLPPKQPVKKFCECTANTFAKLYKDAGISAGSQRYTSLRSHAMTLCTEFPGGIKFPNTTTRPPS